MNADSIMFYTAIGIFTLVCLAASSMWLAHMVALRKAERDPLTASYVQARELRNPMETARLRTLLVARYGETIAIQAARHVRRLLGEVR